MTNWREVELTRDARDMWGPEAVEELTDAERRAGEIHLVWQRRICWPDPDATCLDGGCGWCDQGKWIDLVTIERFAHRAGVLQNRGAGEKEAVQAYNYGLSHSWFRRTSFRRIRRYV